MNNSHLNDFQLDDSAVLKLQSGLIELSSIISNENYSIEHQKICPNTMKTKAAVSLEEFRDLKVDLQHMKIRLDYLEMKIKTIDSFKYQRPQHNQNRNNDKKFNKNSDVIFYCKTSICEGFWFLDKEHSQPIMKCPSCHIDNCVKCNAIHPEISCKEYMSEMRYDEEKNNLDGNSCCTIV